MLQMTHMGDSGNHTKVKQMWIKHFGHWATAATNMAKINTKNIKKALTL